MLRSTVAALLLASAAILPLAAHADTLDVMTVTGNGHTWTFDFPLTQTFTYPANLPLFIPGLTPLSATLDGASIAPGEIFFHNFQNISGPFGQIITPGAGVLDILSVSGPYTNPVTMQSFYAYTSTLFNGTFNGTEFNGITTVPFTISVEQSTAPTPEPSSLALLATGILSFAALIKRRTA
jgi:hypothetical protein